ncbi:hypothetical protein PoB_001513400 [Plakobranchus ocellatus]|uniref:Uncharacterized protein n=1 Tax=Plakobranchus ocellatus TaxID=259542 RepID=A0AAV3Z3P3_9GAST|nr:hypothetical protein PoB_001513400 [Plakobranchus ocellatus]
MSYFWPTAAPESGSSLTAMSYFWPTAARESGSSLTAISYFWPTVALEPGLSLTVMSYFWPTVARASDVRPGCKTQRIAPKLRQVAHLMCARIKEREYFKTCIVGHVNCCLQCAPALTVRYRPTTSHDNVISGFQAIFGYRSYQNVQVPIPSNRGVGGAGDSATHLKSFRFSSSKATGSTPATDHRGSKEVESPKSPTPS